MDISTLTLFLAALTVGPAVYGLMNPGSLAEFARGLARNVTAGYILIAVGTVWFIVILEGETLADFEAYKFKMQVFFALLGVGACIYLKDFLAVRGMAVVLLLLAKLTIETARYADTSWRLVLIVMAYIWIVSGMVFTVSPWRFRDAMDWKFSDEDRTRKMCVVRLLMGLLLLGLGLTVFKTPVVAG